MNFNPKKSFGQLICFKDENDLDEVKEFMRDHAESVIPEKYWNNISVWDVKDENKITVFWEYSP